MEANTKGRGDRAERWAQRYLESMGLKPVQTQYRCRGGELDLVMRHGDSLVFVEVRYRRRTYFGSGAETVDRRKRRRLALAARHYLQRYRWIGPCRFDVCSISGAQGAMKMEWIRDAFALSDL